MSLRHLKIAGVVLPVAFVVASEIVRFLLVEVDLDEEDNNELAGHILLASIMVAAMIVFASAMFHFIHRIQGHILRQNRQLAALNTVSTAVRADLTVDQIVDGALESVLISTGAASASITVHGVDGSPRVRHTPDHTPDAEPSAGYSVRDFALTAGTSSVGTIRLQVPAGGNQPDRLATETLQTIGQQLGHAIQRALLFADLERGRNEAQAFHEVLLQISSQRSLPRTLQTIVTFARDRLGADQVVLCLDDTASRVVRVDAMLSGPPLRGEGLVGVTPDGVQLRPGRAPGQAFESPEDRAEFPANLAVPVGSSGAGFGELWIGRRSATPFDERDRRFLVTLAELTTISVNDARMLEGERQGAILAERERIARELHDSLAQVLGVTHLRLQALRAKPVVQGASDVHAELGKVIDICHDAYADVREAILGLSQSSQPDRQLLDSLRAYLEAFARQSGVDARLESSVEPDLALIPRCEVQVVRVIQEALTNVRKHSGARTAVVRVTQTPSDVVFVIEDDGHGFRLDVVPGGCDGFGFGLGSMRERAQLLGGTLMIDSAPGCGTRVRIEVPAALIQQRPPAESAPTAGSRGI